MANLLSRSTPREPFPALDENQRARFEERARFFSCLDWPGQGRALARIFEGFEGELEELESEPDLVSAHDLLDRIDRARRPFLEASPGPLSGTLGGEWLCYWPGRSLSTGEAEIASRGFFDVRDRPPIGLWVEAIGRRRGRSPDSFELAILAWVPPSALEGALAGCQACVRGSLARVADVSPVLNDQLRALC